LVPGSWGGLAFPAGLGLPSDRAEAALRVAQLRSIGTAGSARPGSEQVQDLALARDGRLLVTDAFHT
jgi:hypothetical protein